MPVPQLFNWREVQRCCLISWLYLSWIMHSFYFQMSQWIVLLKMDLSALPEPSSQACLKEWSMRSCLVLVLFDSQGKELIRSFIFCPRLSVLYSVIDRTIEMEYYNLQVQIMGFGVLALFGLKLNSEIVPSIDGIHGKHFPQKMPLTLLVLCFLNSLIKLAIPMVLQETYSTLSNSDSDSTNYVMLISVVIAAIGLSQLILIAYTLMLSVYRLNVKRELSMRILRNNFRDYKQILEGRVMTDHLDNVSMQLRIKISTKLSVYLHNYYESYLSLIFECFNIVVIFVYLIYKLSFSLFFGVAIAALIMNKTIRTAAEMNKVRFHNIALRARRLKILEEFFNMLTEFKMCWLDKWIYDKITDIEHEYLEGLKKVKLLDCWCVALWQFTSVGISSIVITAYFLLGLNVDKDSVFTPSTFVYLLGMLNFPLNALSWYIAGIKTAHTAIEQIKKDIRISSKKQPDYKKIQKIQGSYVISEPIELQLELQSSTDHEKQYKSLILPKWQLRKNRIYSVNGSYAEKFMDKLVFLFGKDVKRGFVEENAWLSSSPLEAVKMQQNLTSLGNQQRDQILRLMQLFHCSDIPLNTCTKNYSGGQKLRISLVRAFHLGEVIVMNTNLKSLDAKMHEEVKGNIRRLVDKCFDELDKDYTIFVRENEDIADFSLDLNEHEGHIEASLQQIQHKAVPQQKIKEIALSQQIVRFKKDMKLALKAAADKAAGKIRRYSVQKLTELDKMQERSVVSFSTFKIYYKSRKHIAFIVALIFVTVLSNYYNYYVNTYVDLSEYNQNQVIFIITVTLVFAIGLFFRAYYFADANLDEAVRISHSVNRNIIMNELSFYNSQPTITEDVEAPNSKHKLICVLTSDSETIADRFPFDTNIFANNIVVILSSIVIIVIEVPPVIIIMVFLVLYANHLNKISHKKDEFLKIAIKQKDVDVYKILSEMEDGKKYLIIHDKFREFSSIFSRHHEESYTIDWLNQKFKNYINLKYKLVMMLFLIVAVVLYSVLHVFREPEDIVLNSPFQTTSQSSSKSSSGLALLIQYTIQLSNYLLFFTMSIWDIKGQAVSIQRSKSFIDETESVGARTMAADKMIQKFRNQNADQIRLGEVLVDINKLNFAYQSNMEVAIFKNLSLLIKKGDKIMIKGRSGSGKTTLYKLLSSAYPQRMNFVDSPFAIYFSPQHPLVLPDTTSIEENFNPYNVPYDEQQIREYFKKFDIDLDKSLADLTYQQKIVINNLRGYLYGGRGIVIYDQPQLVVDSRADSTYLIVTHHHEFTHTQNLLLQDGDLLKV